MSRARLRQTGFTLVEVMVSLVISSLLVGMILSIFSRMSLAYRGQQGVAELQQILAAGHGLIADDLRQAGFQMPDGFLFAGDLALHQPVEVINDVDNFGPDEVHMFYADASAQARVVDFNGSADSATAAFTVIQVDDAGDFVAGDLIAIVKAQSGTPDEVAFFSCVAQIATLNATTINLAVSGTWGTPNNDQCDQVRTDLAIGTDNRAMVYRFRAHGYRIDPNRRDLAVLQLSRSAGFADDWQDLAVGFTDLQVATRWDDSDDNTGELLVDTVDLDVDPRREWYSDVTQAGLSAPRLAAIGVPPSGTPTAYIMASYDHTRPRLVSARVTLVVRTHTRVDVVPSLRTPKLLDDVRPGNNDVGDRDEVQLEGVADAARPQELRGNHVYRYSTVGTDLRNMGVGL